MSVVFAMVRHPHWDVRLLAWAESIRGQPFEWGMTDCGSLVRRAVTAMYDRDCWPEATYQSVAEAVRYVAVHGGVADHLVRLGAVAVPLVLAQTGDIALDPEAHDGLGAAWVLLGATALAVEPGAAVTAIPRTALPVDLLAYRLPWEVPRHG